MKKTIIILIILLVLALIVGLSRESKPRVSIPEIPTPTGPTELCYYRNEKTASGLYDRAWMKLTVNEEKVSGELRLLPAEKDSKIGDFTGTFTDISEGGTIAGDASVIWNTKAEGMTAKEELSFYFDDIFGGADAGVKIKFGEMVKGANGVYVYKNKANTTTQTIPPVDCAVLNEVITVEAYIRSTDLVALTKTSPVLGGKLYVTGVVVDPTAHNALVSYEDGHMAYKGTLTYTFSQSKVTPVNFVETK